MMVMKRLLSILAALIVFVGGGCTNTPPSDEDTGAMEVLFTDPYADEDILDRTITLIENAQKTIDVAAYDIDRTDLADALVDAKARGVSVRVVCNDDSYYADDNGVFTTLEDAGIPVHTDNDPSRVMHNKVIIFDSITVWTGSTNLTYNGFERNNNNLLIIEKRDLSLEYLREFHQMFELGLFHNDKESNGVEHFTVDGATVEVLFSPEDDTETMLVDAVNSSQGSLDFAIFSFTLTSVRDAMIAAHNRGVAVRGIMDERIAGEDNAIFNALTDAGISVKLDDCPYAFHHKFMVIDAGSAEAVVVTGSGNWSNNGTHISDENFLVIKNDASIIMDYSQEFERWWNNL